MKHLISGLIKFTATSILVISLLACGGAEERKVEYLEKGKAYLADKNYEKAKIEFKNVLQIDPKFAEAYFFMGQLAEKKKELGKALGNYKKTIELDPKHTEAKIKLAKIYVIAGTESYLEQASELILQAKQEQPENVESKLVAATIEYKSGSKAKAVSDLESIVAKNGGFVEGVSLLSTIYISQGEEEKATKILTEGAKNNPKDISLRVTLAKILSKNKDYSAAEKYLQQAINIDPEKYLLKVALSSLYAISNQLDKAESILRSAIEQDDEDAQRYLVLVELLSSRVNLKKGEDELKLAIKNKPDLYELRFAQVSFYEKTGKRDEAKAVLKQIITEKSYDVEGVKARIKLANYFLEEGDQKAAKNYVEEVTAEYPNNNDALLITSKLALANMDAVVAVNGLRTYVKNNPKNAEASLLLAKAHELNNESSLAEDVLKKGIEANPVNAKTHVNYAHYLASKGRLDEAAAVVDKALTYFKDSYNLMDVKLKILATQGKEPEVLALLDNMEQVAPKKAEVNIARGHYYLAKKDSANALDQFKSAYAKSFDKYNPLKLIIKSYLVDKQTDKALEHLQNILKEKPDDPSALLLTGQIFLMQKNFAGAKSKFEQASKAAETWFLPYTSLASLYIADKNPEQAKEVYQQAISKLKNKVPAQLQLAAIHERQKEFSVAMRIYQEILEVNSANKLAANNYASLMLDHGQEADIKKALDISKSFEKIKEPALQDTLGWAYAKSGDNIKAVEILKPVVDSTPKAAVFRYHLGYALYYMGDKAAAKSHLEIAVASEQNFVGKDKAQELLKSI